MKYIRNRRESLTRALPLTPYIAAATLLCMSGALSAAPDNTNATEACVKCHGEDGMGHGISTIPIIAGMPAPHIEEAIYAYIDEARHCTRMQEMCETVAALSEEEIAQVAEHYANLPRHASDEEFDATLAAEGAALHASRCAICHLRPDDEDVEYGLGIPLHGQRKEYIRFAIQDYIQGDRISLLDPMAVEIRALKPGELDALVNYYASYRQ